MALTAVVGDFGGTHLRAALVSESGQVLHRHERHTPRSIDQAAILATVVDLMVEAARGETPAAACIATAGLVNADAGKVGISPNIPAFRNLVLTGPVSQALGIPAFIENDASAAALGEFRFGAGRGRRHLLHATLGTGIGGGIVINGRLYRGAHGLAGRIGHLVLDPAGPQCNCGSRGCLEALVSGVAFARRARRLTERGASTILADIVGDEEPSGEHLARAAEAGDPVARAEISNGGHLLGLALGGLINVLNPDAVTLSGGLLEMGEPFLDPMRAAIRGHAYGAASHTPVLLSELGEDAGLLGAAAVAFERLEDGA